MFEIAQEYWFKRSSIGDYSLRWGIEHGLAENKKSEVKVLLCKPSFLRCFHHKHRMNALVTYWHIVAPNEDGSSYRLEVQDLLKQSVNIKRGRQMNSMMHLFRDCSWHKEGAKHIDLILEWVKPLEKKHPKLVSSLKMDKGSFVMAQGDIVNGLSGYIVALDTLSSRNSKSAKILQQVFQKIQNAMSRASLLKKADYQEMWTELQESFPITDRNRFSIELMMVEYIFETIEEQVDYIEQLRDRLPHVDDPKAKKGYKDRLLLSLDEQKFQLLCKSKQYKEALSCGNLLMDRMKEFSLSGQVKVLCKMGQCCVHLKLWEGATALYKRLQEGWLHRIQDDRSQLHRWYEFSEILGKSYARNLKKKNELEKALQWSNMEVEATLWNLNHLRDNAKAVGVSLNGNKQNVYAISVYHRANIYKSLNRYAEAKEDYLTSIDVLEKLYTYPKSIFRKNLSLALYMFGILCEQKEDTEEALRIHQRSLDIRSSLRSVRSDMQDYWLKSAIKVSSLMWKQYASQKEEYVEEYFQLLSLRKEIHANTGTNSRLYGVVLVLNVVGCLHLDKKEWGDALPFFTEAHGFMEELCTSEPDKELYERGCRKMLLRRALCHAHCHEKSEAIALLEMIGYSTTEEDLTVQIENWIDG